MYLDAAIAAYENRNSFNFDVIEFLYDLAFVVERSKSIGWWLDIGSHFNETGELKNETLENLALEYIEEAQQATVYSSIIIEEAGITGDSLTYLSYAEDLLQTSRNNLTAGYPAAALFQALEATVRANLAIEVIGAEPENKIELAKKSASEKISKSRLHGIEPVLAVSYYEYGESLFNETEYDSSLLYYKYSGMIAGVLTFTNVTTGTTSSKYVGIPELKETSGLTWFIKNLEILVIIAILSAIAGLGLGLIISGMALNKKGKKEQVVPKITQDYEKAPRHPYFSKEDMPRSITDYYKKNK
jgi:predicted S18 family serine protease